MNFYKSVRREQRIVSFWFVPTCIFLYLFAFGYETMESLSAYKRIGMVSPNMATPQILFFYIAKELVIFLIVQGILFFVARAIYNSRMFSVENYIGDMSEEEKLAFDKAWGNCTTKYEHGKRLIAVVDRYLVVKNKGLTTKWFMVPIREIRQVFLKDGLVGKKQVAIAHQDAFLSMRGINPYIYHEILTDAYKTSEAEEIVNFIKPWLDREFETRPYHLESKLFDDVGMYGGKQEINRDMPEYMRDAVNQMISQKYNRDLLSREEFNLYLDRMGSEGCGYMALVNAILLYFEDKEEEFFRRFGYPLYGENGDFCFDYLMLDLYSSMDNVTPIFKKRDYFLDYNPTKDGPKKSYDYWKDSTGRGTTPEERAFIIKEFAKKHGLKAEYEPFYNVTPENFERLSKEGWMVIAALYEGTIYGKYDSQKVASHAMLVTGVTMNGNYIATSWGKRYTFNPQKNKNLCFAILKLCAIL